MRRGILAMPRYVVDQVLRARPHLGRQSSRLDEVLRAGEWVSIGAALGTAQTQDNAAIINAQNAKDARMKKQLEAAAAAAETTRKADAKTALAAKEEKDFLENMFEDIKDAKQRETAKEKLVAKMKRTFDRKIGTSYDMVDQNENEKLDTLEILSFTEATTYQANLLKINKIYEDALDTTEGLLPMMIDVARRYIDTNKEEIQRMEEYLPKIKRALDAEVGWKLDAVRLQAADDLQARQYKVDEMAAEATLAAEQAATSEATLKKRIRTLQIELRQADAEASAAQQAYEKCTLDAANDAMADEKVDAAALREADDKYQSLKREAGAKILIWKSAAQTATEFQTETLEPLEAQLQQAKNNAKLQYEKYTKWEKKHIPNLLGPRERRTWYKTIAEAKERVNDLTNQLEAAEARFDTLDNDVKMAYINKEVANAAAQAAKKRMDKLKIAENVVAGFPV